MANPLALVWDLIATNNASAGLDEAAASADGTAAAMDKASVSSERAATRMDAAGDAAVEAGGKAKEGMLGFGLLGDAIAAVFTIDAVKHIVESAATFQSAMLLIQTQAGGTAKDVKQGSKAILDMAGSLGTAPDALANSFYHAMSVTHNYSESLGVMKIAAEGAKVGHADLEQTTNGLTAVIASGISGVQNYSQAMGALNSIVGSGDMKMSDLNETLSTGVLATVKTAGVSITQFGAAIATLGDNNIRGAKAGTDLRMAIQAMQKPVLGGAAALASIGLTSKSLATDLQKGGLTDALRDLKTHMDKAGDSGKKAGAFITAAFGKKAGVGLAVLEDQVPRYNLKLHEITEGAKGFGAAWDATKKTAGFALDSLKANADALGIKIGTALLPPVTKAAVALSDFVTWLMTNKTVAKDVSDVMGVLGDGVKIVVGWFEDGVTWVKAHRVELEALAQTIEGDVITAFMTLKADVIGVITTLTDYYEKHRASFEKTFTKVEALVKQYAGVLKSEFAAIEAVIKTVVKIVEDLWDRFGDHLIDHLHTTVDSILEIFRGALDIMKGIFDLVDGILTGKWSKAWDGIKEIFQGVWTAILGLLKLQLNELSTMIGAWMAAVSAVWDLAWHALLTALKPLWGQIQNFVEGQIKLVKSYFSDAINWLQQAGKDIINGLIKGMESMVGAAVNAVKNVGKSIVKGAEDIFKIKSPSVVFHQIGLNVVQGLVNGMSASQASATKAAQTLAFTITNEISKVLSTDASGSATSISSAMNSLIKSIFTGFSGDAGRNGLVSFLQGENTQLTALATARAAIATKLTAATKALTTVEASFTSEKNTVATAVTGGFNLGSLGSSFDAFSGGGSAVDGVIQSLKSVLSGEQGDTSSLSRLKKLGLSPALLQQLGEAGVSGQSIANALAGATKGQIAQINSMAGQSAAYGSQSGSVVASSLFGSTITADSNTVKSLQNEQVSNEKLAVLIGDQVGKVISGLGIKVTSDDKGILQYINLQITKNNQVLSTAAGYH